MLIVKLVTLSGAWQTSKTQLNDLQIMFAIIIAVVEFVHLSEIHKKWMKCEILRYWRDKSTLTKWQISDGVGAGSGRNDPVPLPYWKSIANDQGGPKLKKKYILHKVWNNIAAHWLAIRISVVLHHWYLASTITSSYSLAAWSQLKSWSMQRRWIP